ncbi:Transforming growth factor-beta-induced protein ig-h3 [Ceratocystis lukuohia]|uniref:Transforming growth factor-beta-induced protein ig-h3 n=2 Tax=Ceratocystis TaxID=5157 RepID=A0A0F8DHV2_CERFI|nr:Transforming growth factor-beta-induced protein ig-h3 [Ceratocystis platani]
MRYFTIPISLFALGAYASTLPVQPVMMADKSVYDVIRGLGDSIKFQQHVDKNPDIRARLQDLSNKYTVFVPNDEAFEKLPDHVKDRMFSADSAEFLKYHIAHGDYAGAGMLALHTIPSLLHEEDIGDHLQRIRIDAGLTSTNINFYAKILGSNTDAANGAVHQLDSVLIDPPRQGKLLQHFPGDFSTTKLGLDKTRLDKWLHRQSVEGGTAFVPSNKAWEGVKDDVRNWLFSDDGLEYLRVVLEYHVVFDRTLYSDTLYFGKEEDRHHETPAHRVLRIGKRVASDEFLWYVSTAGETPECKEGPIPGEANAQIGSSCKINFPTVLEKSQLDVEVSRLLGHVKIRLNDKVDVQTMDGIARDGVLHSIDEVLLPCHKNGKNHKHMDDKLLKDLELDELKKYLKEFVEHDSRKVGGHNHWMDGSMPHFKNVMEEETGRVVVEKLEDFKEHIHHILDEIEL